eukprot:5236730-Amphidinium_carterae.1
MARDFCPTQASQLYLFVSKRLVPTLHYSRKHVVPKEVGQQRRWADINLSAYLQHEDTSIAKNLKAAGQIKLAT